MRQRKKNRHAAVAGANTMPWEESEAYCKPTLVTCFTFYKVNIYKLNNVSKTQAF